MRSDTTSLVRPACGPPHALTPRLTRQPFISPMLFFSLPRSATRPRHAGPGRPHCPVSLRPRMPGPQPPGRPPWTPGRPWGPCFLLQNYAREWAQVLWSEKAPESQSSFSSGLSRCVVFHGWHLTLTRSSAGQTAKARSLAPARLGAGDYCHGPAQIGASLLCEDADRARRTATPHSRGQQPAHAPCLPPPSSLGDARTSVCC